MAVQQLETLTGVARGLTRVTDSLLALDDSPDVQAAMREMEQACGDPRVVKLREALLSGIRNAVELWSTDATVSDVSLVPSNTPRRNNDAMTIQALSDFFKAITALPSDVTLVSLPAGPLLELVCMASQKQLTAVWLTLATMLIIQLNPPSLVPTTFKPEPSAEAADVALNVLTVLLQTSLSAFSQEGVMISVSNFASGQSHCGLNLHSKNPDVVQAFYGCMESVSYTMELNRASCGLCIPVCTSLPPCLLPPTSGPLQCPHPVRYQLASATGALLANIGLHVPGTLHPSRYVRELMSLSEYFNQPHVEQ